MVNLMLNLFVNHIVENYPAIDYIAIKTKKGEEISLNWEESEYSWNDDQSGSGRSLKKQMPKDIHAELRNVYFDAEEEGHTISDSVKRESLKGAEIEEIQIFIENFSGRKEDVGFWLQQMVFHFSAQFADWIDLTTAGAGDTGDGMQMALDVGGVFYNDPYKTYAA